MEKINNNGIEVGIKEAITEAKEPREYFNAKFLRYLDDLEKSYERKYLFWEIVHNIGNLFVYLVCLPFVPIISIIKAIKGKDNV